MQVWLIAIADERVGVQVKPWNPLRKRAIPERFCGDDSLYEEALYQVYAPLPLPLSVLASSGGRTERHWMSAIRHPVSLD